MKPLVHSVILALAIIPMLARADIRFTVSVPVGIHRLSEKLPIEIRIENLGSEPLYLYRSLNYFISVFVSTADGKEVSPDSIYERRPPPPNKDSFTQLYPGHFLGKVWQLDLKSLGIHGPGSYRLSLNYQTDLGPDFTFGLPVWSGSKSASIQIEVSN